MTVEKIIETNKLLVMIDFANREAEKILARAKELNKEADNRSPQSGTNRIELHSDATLLS
jgi:hypothetical protein